MGRCKSLGSLKLFLSYASQLHGASILCFSHPEFLRAHCREWLQPNGHRYSSPPWVPLRLRNSHCLHGRKYFISQANYLTLIFLTHNSRLRGGFEILRDFIRMENSVELNTYQILHLTNTTKPQLVHLKTHYCCGF